MPLPPPSPPRGEEQELSLPPSPEEGPGRHAGIPQQPLHSLLRGTQGKTAWQQRPRRGPAPPQPLPQWPTTEPRLVLTPAPPKDACLAPPKDACLTPPKDACLASPKDACLASLKDACLASLKVACCFTSPGVACCYASPGVACCPTSPVEPLFTGHLKNTGSPSSYSGAPEWHPDTPYSLESAGPIPSYATADRGREFPGGGVQLAKHCPCGVGWLTAHQRPLWLAGRLQAGLYAIQNCVVL
ncbi:UNVERIFIED_CONTAM: hypothetical protein FKN15_014616 [Acipenser sinensis]